MTRRTLGAGAAWLLFAAAWLLFAAANLAFSGHQWLWLIPGLLPPMVYLAVPLGLAVLGALGPPVRWLTWLAMAGLLIGLPQCGLNLAALGGGPGPAPTNALRVFSWNAEVWNVGDDPTRFYAFLQAQHADVYLLQEYQPTQDPDDSARLRAAFPGYTIVNRGELLTLTRLPVRGSRDLPGPAPAEDWQSVYEHVKALRVDVAVNGGVLSVYNVHLPVQVDLQSPLHAAFYRLLRQRDTARRIQLRGLVRDLDANAGPVLVAGDFNTSPAMGDIRALTSRLSSATPANRSLYPTSWDNHWPVELWRLDWAFTSDGVRVYRQDFRDARGMSDHRAQELLITVGGGS